jgi:diacylglycerol O-acyltransferase / wax synthase
MTFKRLNGMDAMLLYSETPNLHSHTVKVLHMSTESAGGQYSFEDFRRAMEQRLSRLEPLGYRLVDIPWRIHHPMWWPNSDIDLDYHLRRIRVPSPGTQHQLDGLIGEIMSTQLDRSRPLWEFYFVEGMPCQRVAVIAKMHHALADGMASANLLARLMGITDGEADDPGHVYAEAVPSKPRLMAIAARDHAHQLSTLPAFVKDAFRGAMRVRRHSKLRHRHVDLARSFRAPKCFLNHVVSPVRTVATVALPLADVKQAAKHLDVTFNDVILAVVAGGLRQLLLRYDGAAARPLLATVPVSTDRCPDRITGNEIGGITVSLPVHIEDPLKRVRLVSLGTARAKEDNDSIGPTLQSRMMGYLPATVAPLAFRWHGRRAAANRAMNIAVSSVPGPRQRGNIGGAVVTSIYSVGVLSPGSAMNVTVWSYADQVCISVLSDDATFGDVHEATAALTRSFGEIIRAAGTS